MSQPPPFQSPQTDRALPRGFAAADDEALEIARNLLAQAMHGSLATIDAADHFPNISQITLQVVRHTNANGLFTLISDLARHSSALKAQPNCAVMISGAGEKGDPMTWPRLMIRARAQYIPLSGIEDQDLRAHWGIKHPKAKLWLGLADFKFVRLVPFDITLNAGFGKAFAMAPDALGI